MAVECKLTGLSGNEIYCMRLKGLIPSGVVIGNSIQSMGFLGGGPGTALFTSAGDHSRQGHLAERLRRL